METCPIDIHEPMLTLPSLKVCLILAANTSVAFWKFYRGFRSTIRTNELNRYFWRYSCKPFIAS